MSRYNQDADMVLFLQPYVYDITAGRSTVGHASSLAPGSSSRPYGCAAVPHHGVDVEWQNTRRAHQQTEG